MLLAKPRCTVPRNPVNRVRIPQGKGRSLSPGLIIGCPLVVDEIRKCFLLTLSKIISMTYYLRPALLLSPL